MRGVVLTMFDPRNNLAGQVVADVRQFMGNKVYETIIPRNVRISEAPVLGIRYWRKVQKTSIYRDQT